MARTLALSITLLLGIAAAQTPGNPDEHPILQTWKCTVRHGCVSQNSQLVIDSSNHKLVQREYPTLSCYNSTNSALLNSTVCPTQDKCSDNCVLEGFTAQDYANHGVSTSGATLKMHQVKKGVTVSPRLYLMDNVGDDYEMIKLTGNEISFDVDSSKLPCGMNGALYLAEMTKNGGRGHLNPAGSAYGTGYCDAQCSDDTFINGIANLAGKGSCCNEMDIWEANEYATALTPHTCNQTGLYECTGEECSWSGVCDQWGCSSAPYALGNPNYYGPKDVVDSSKTLTVVTQFPTFPNGTLKSINRLYVQHGKIIQNAYVNVSGLPDQNFIDANFCSTSASRFVPLGGMQEMGEAMKRGMVLIFSIWWDVGGYMNWLDTGSSGPCNTTEGNPSVIVQVQPDPMVTWSNVKWGEIGSTYTGT